MWWVTVSEFAMKKFVSTALLIITVTITRISTDKKTSYLTSSGCWRCGDECYPREWICDRREQCNDNSDEGTVPGQGCNLYPDSNCTSFGGRRHYMCQRTGDCFSEESEARTCDESEIASTNPPSRSCTLGMDSLMKGWRCGDGQCIKLEKVYYLLWIALLFDFFYLLMLIVLQVCNRHPDCSDRSDEDTSPYSGCNKYPEREGNCSSWFGKYHKLCHAEDRVVCAPDNIEATSGTNEKCRTCPDQPGFWRCDDGWCIDSLLVRNGRFDCPDRSDEDQLISVGLILLFLYTMIVVIIGLLISYICRFEI